MRAEDFFRELDCESPEIREVAAEVDPPFILASNAYHLRRARGLTQEQLAERIGVRQPRIAEIERGDANPRLDTLAKLARALGVTVSALLDEDFADSEGAEGPGRRVEYVRRGERPARRVAEPG